MVQTRRRYVHQGSLIGDPYWIDKPWHAYIDWKRVAWIVVPLLVLCVTNPANQEAWGSMISSTTTKTSSKWLAPRVTNYAIFSFEEKIEGVVISGLQQSYLCEFRSTNVGDFCEYLADNMCHRKPLWGDTGDLAFISHRMLCWILILWSAFVFICPTAPPRRIVQNQYLDGFLFSIFYKPHNPLHDLAYETFCVYPALVEMAKVIPKLNNGSILVTGDNTFDFLMAVFILVVIIGGGSNVLASRIDGQRSYVTGFAPVIAASLGYYHRINVVRSTILMSLYGIDMTAIRLYWSSIAWIVFAYPNNWYPRLVAWLAAGLGGSLLAKYHLENIAVWGDVLKFFGLA